MNVPFFYAADLNKESRRYALDEKSARHCLQVLRKREGDIIALSDGRGRLRECIIERASKKECLVRIQSTREVPAVQAKLAIGISFTKNISRIEWFLEKATEIGITDIYPLTTRRTERVKFNKPRLENIIIAAMLQSEQAWLPHLHEQVSFENLIGETDYDVKLIAHCENEEKHFLADKIERNKDTLVLIGPEGDFTPEEISLARKHYFTAVSLGPHRLRTETAGIVTCVMLSEMGR